MVDNIFKKGIPFPHRVFDVKDLGTFRLRNNVKAFFKKNGLVGGPVGIFNKAVKSIGDNRNLFFRPKVTPEKVENKFDTSTFSDLPEVLKVPQPLKAPAWEANLKQYNLANWLDDSPIQTGLSKIMCDLYCTESAVKESGNAILESTQSTAETLQGNLQNLLDYHSQLIFYGLGQLRSDLAPSPAAAAFFEESDKSGAGASNASLTSRIESIESELKDVTNFTKQLKFDIDPSAWLNSKRQSI